MYYPLADKERFYGEFKMIRFFFCRFFFAISLLVPFELQANLDTRDAQLRLYVLECGYMDMSRWPYFEEMYGVPHDAVEITAQVNPCFLILNGDKSLMWDGGLPDHTSVSPSPGPHGVIVSMPVKLNDQLAEIGISPDTIDYFALSHLHFDHLGNWNYFKTSQVIVQELEWKAATSKNQERQIGYDAGITAGLASLDNLLLIDGDYDVFGDGSVMLISAPGHTNGSQFIVIKLKDFGPIIISGDVIHFREELEHGVVPKFNIDAKESKNSIRKIVDYTERLDGKLWIQHDPVQHKERAISPQFYR